MKPRIKNMFLLPALVAGLSLFLATSAQAQFQLAKRIASTTNTDIFSSGYASSGMTLDSQGNSYVTGLFDGTNNFGGVTLTNNNPGGQDIFVAKYNSIGAFQWAQQAGGASGNWNAGRGIGVDTNGNVYVTGAFFGNADFGSFNATALTNEEFFLAKYDSAGTVQWVRQSVGGNGMSGMGFSDGVEGAGLAVDDVGNCYAVGFAANVTADGTPILFGTTNLPNANTDGGSAFLIKYDNTGTVKWAQLFDSSQESYATKVAVDATGNVYVRGTFFSSMTIGSSNLVVSPAGSHEKYVHRQV